MQAAAPLSAAAIFLRFLRFGLMAWGGPVAQIAMLRRELVEQQAWVSGPRFNRILAVFQILPGPEAHELCVHLGMIRGGRAGGIAAGLGFMLPGLVLMLLASWLYFRLDIAGGALAPVFLGVQFTVLALIVRAVHQIGRHALLDVWLWAAAAGAAAAGLAGAPFWIVLPAASLAYAGLRRGRRVLATCVVLTAGAVAVLLPAGSGGAPPSPEPANADLLALLLSGLKVGLLTFGGAYAAIPFLRDDAVGRGWLSEAQFLDGVALAGALPAPLIIFSAFVGWAAGGAPGALLMTAGVFLPAFAFSLVLFERIEALAEARRLRSFLGGVTAAVVGLIAAAAFELAQALLVRTPSLPASALIFALALSALYGWRNRASVPLTVLGGGLAGVLLFG